MRAKEFDRPQNQSKRAIYRVANFKRRSCSVRIEEINTERD